MFVGISTFHVSTHLRSSPGAVGHVGAALPPEATTPARVGRGEAAAAGDSQRHCPSAAGAQAAGVVYRERSMEIVMDERLRGATCYPLGVLPTPLGPYWHI